MLARLFAICCTIALVGCTEPITRKLPVVVAKSEASYSYGRFAVVGERIIGGRFAPQLPPAVDATKGTRHLIVVSFAQKSLEYYERKGDEWVARFGRAVVTPAVEELGGRVERGIVRSIDTQPTWCPTRNIRAAYPKLPGGCLPFGHPENAMGAAKFIIDWEHTGWETIRIHGTTGFPERFAEVETFGCVRLLNSDIVTLIEMLGPDEIAQGIEIVFF